jgi:hypothetical protein
VSSALARAQAGCTPAHSATFPQPPSPAAASCCVVHTYAHTTTQQSREVLLGRCQDAVPARSLEGIAPIHLQRDTAAVGYQACAKGMPDDLAATLGAYAKLQRCQESACAGVGGQGT